MRCCARWCPGAPGALSHVPYAEYKDHKELYVRAHLGPVKSQEAMQVAMDALKMADLREFFPQGLVPVGTNRV